MASQKRTRSDDSLGIARELRERVEALKQTRDDISQIIVRLETQLRRIEGTERSVGSSDTETLLRKKRTAHIHARNARACFPFTHKTRASTRETVPILSGRSPSARKQYPFGRDYLRSNDLRKRAQIS